MKKLFTFVFCAFCALSLQATVVEIGTGGTTGTSAYAPIYVSGTTYTSLTQMLYLSSEITSSGITEGTITAISFYSKDFLGTAEIPKSRTIEVWVDLVNSLSFSGNYFYRKSNSSPEAGTKVFSGTVSMPIIEGWYTITLDTPFAWNSAESKKNIVITINDISKTRTATGEKKHKTYTATANRTRYKTGGNDGTSFNAANTWNIQGTATNVIPVIKFTFEGGEDPDPTPTINNPSVSSLEYGTIYLDEGDVEKTFKVTASDLTNDITLITNASAGVTISPSEIAKDNTDLAGDGVAVTVTLSKGYPFPITNPTVTIASEGATSKSVTIKATEGSFTPLSTMASLNTNGYFLLNFDATINSINTSDKSMEIRNVSPKNANYTLIDGQAIFAVGGIFNGLKGKYENEVFKIFSYTSYTAPDPSTSIEIDEDVDNHDTWPEEAQSGKSLIIKRAIVPNQWNSIVLPTYLTSTEVESVFGSGTDLEEFTNAVVTSSNITLNFTKKTNGLEAGVPYLIKPTQAIANPLNLTNHSFTKTVTPVDNNGIRFEGVLVPTQIDGGDGSDYIIVGANNTLFHPTGEGTIKGMRAYFHVVGPAAIAALKTAKVSMNTGSTTELVLVKDNQVKPYKTMVNDQIVIVNEGKQINILGQIVK